MPLINPDTSQALEMGAIEPGTYPGKITAVDYGKSKSGNNMITVSIEVMVEGKPRPRKAYHVISGEGSYGFDQLLRATGFADLADAYKDPTQENPPFDTDSLLGQEFMVVVDSQIYNGEKRDQIKTYLKS